MRTRTRSFTLLCCATLALANAACEAESRTDKGRAPGPHPVRTPGTLPGPSGGSGGGNGNPNVRPTATAIVTVTPPPSPTVRPTVVPTAEPTVAPTVDPALADSDARWKRASKEALAEARALDVDATAEAMRASGNEFAFCAEVSLVKYTLAVYAPGSNLTDAQKVEVTSRALQRWYVREAAGILCIH